MANVSTSFNHENTGRKVFTVAAAALLANATLPSLAHAALVQDRRSLNQTNQIFELSAPFYSTSGPAVGGRLLIIEQTITPDRSGQLATISFDAVVKFRNASGSPATAVNDDFTRGRLVNNPLPMDVFLWDKSSFDFNNPQQGVVSFQSIGRVAAPPARTGRDRLGQATFGMTYQFQIPATQSSFTALIGFGMRGAGPNEAFFVQNAIQRSDLLFESSPDRALSNDTGAFIFDPLRSFGGLDPVPPLASVQLSIPSIPNIPEPTLLLNAALLGALMARRRLE